VNQILVTCEVYEEAAALSLLRSKGGNIAIVFPELTPDGQHVIWVDHTTYSWLSDALGKCGETYSDVILKYVKTAREFGAFELDKGER
jgi:hypothetical protein